MSYCCSGWWGLNMYNTSRHDHFLWLKPLKMAPYFLKPIDLPSKSVCVVQNLPALSTRDCCSPHRLSSSQTPLKDRDVHELTRIITIFYDSQMWLTHNKYMVVRPLGSASSPLDNVTVFVPHWIYCPGKDTDGQKPTVAHKPVKPTWYIMQRRKRKITIHLFLPNEIRCK